MNNERSSEDVVVLTEGALVVPIAGMQLMDDGVAQMVEWVRSRRAECLPSDFDSYENVRNRVKTLFPHDMVDGSGRALTGNELLVELAGRKCYDSFGRKAGRPTNAGYIANTQRYDPPHASIEYHAKMSFFVGGVSRRVSHELIRHYVGADRDEEGSPSQESTRYVEHAGRFVAHPAILHNPSELERFRSACAHSYGAYRDYIERRFREHVSMHSEPPKGLERKRVFESASMYLLHSCETSFIWTTNPIALAKMIKERDNTAADLEFMRLAKKWKQVAVETWPNVFPQPWMNGSGQ